ncbi:Uncharacterised protein [Mycobacteroides abscessus subsp. abscessus]|nr:Uncharacterised protein [Mycobacteroides abscessus subsp. abscessus]
MVYPPARPEQPYWVDIAIRVAGGLVGALGLGIFGLAAFAVLSSRFSSNPFADPHGYGLVFGMLLAVPFGLLAAGHPAPGVYARTAAPGPDHRFPRISRRGGRIGLLGRQHAGASAALRDKSTRAPVQARTLDFAEWRQARSRRVPRMRWSSPR